MFYGRAYLPAVLLAAVTLLIAACGEEAAVEREVIRPVRYQQVFLGNVSRVRTFSGVSQAGIESNLSFKVAGSLNRVLVKVGDRVNLPVLLSVDDTLSSSAR